MKGLKPETKGVKPENKGGKMVFSVVNEKLVFKVWL